MRSLFYMHLLWALVISSLWASQQAYGDESKAIISRGQDELLRFEVNVGGTLTETASMGDPNNCATSGATICAGIVNDPAGETCGANCDSCDADAYQYSRNGGIVTVSFRLTLDATAINTLTECTVPIPYPSDFTQSEDVNIVCNMRHGSNDTGGGGGFAETTADAIFLRMNADTASGRTYSCTGQYEVK